MNWLQRLFGKKEKVIQSSVSNRPVVERNILREGDDKYYLYDPLDMINPLNPISPLSPFWIGDQDSIGDVHELPPEVQFGGGEFGCDGTWSGSSGTSGSSGSSGTSGSSSSSSSSSSCD
jgi:uncharacterized membrane protein YgcG